MKALLIAALAVAALLWLTRPFSLDLLRYGVWRAVEGRAFVNSSVVSADARIGYRTIGPLTPTGPARPPLLLLHGGFGSDLDWYAEIPTLARRHALVLVDTRGHGGSTLGKQPLSYRLFARDVLAVLDALGIDRVDVAGWSDGGNTGLRLAREHPARVRRLVAISVNASPEGLVPRMREALAQGETKGSLPARLLHAVLSPESDRWDELANGVTALWRGYPRLGEEDLRAIGAPTLIVAGSEDDVHRGHLDEIARTLPDARLVVLPGVGHAVPQSAPRRLLELMAAFLDGT